MSVILDHRKIWQYFQLQAICFHTLNDFSVQPQCTTKHKHHCPSKLLFVQLYSVKRTSCSYNPGEHGEKIKHIKIREFYIKKWRKTWNSHCIWPGMGVFWHGCRHLSGQNMQCVIQSQLTVDDTEVQCRDLNTQWQKNGINHFFTATNQSLKAHRGISETFPFTCSKFLSVPQCYDNYLHYLLGL